jgi:hypothetical protein
MITWGKREIERKRTTGSPAGVKMRYGNNARSQKVVDE